MTSLPELPPELQRLIRERAYRKSSLAEAEVLTGRAIAAETRRMPVNDVMASGVRGRRLTVKLAQVSFRCDGPEVMFHPESDSGLYASDPPIRPPQPTGSSAEPSFHGRPGTGTRTGTPFRDSVPDELYSINRYRNYCHPPRPSRSPSSTGGNYCYPLYLTSRSPSPLSPYSPSPPNPFSVVACHLLPRARDTGFIQSASPVWLPWKQSSASEAFPDATELTSSIRSGVLTSDRTKNGPPLRRTCSAPQPPCRCTPTVFYATDRGVTITGDPSFHRQGAYSNAALNKLCMSITRCNVTGEIRLAAKHRTESLKKLQTVSLRRRRHINPHEMSKLTIRNRQKGFPNTDGLEFTLNGEVPTNDGTNGTLTNGPVPVHPVRDGNVTITDGTDYVNDGTNTTQSGTISVPADRQVTTNHC